MKGMIIEKRKEGSGVDSATRTGQMGDPGYGVTMGQVSVSAE